MKKFLASLVLCVTLVAFAAPAFAGVDVIYHNITGDKEHGEFCSDFWCDDSGNPHFWDGNRADCPLCRQGIGPQ